MIKKPLKWEVKNQDATFLKLLESDHSDSNADSFRSSNNDVDSSSAYLKFKTMLLGNVFKVFICVLIVLLFAVTSAYASEYFVSQTDTVDVQIELNEHRNLMAPPVEKGSYVYTWSYCAGVFQDLTLEKDYAYVNLPVKHAKQLEVDISMVQQYQLSPNLAKFRCLVSDLEGNIVAEQIYKVSVKTDSLTALISSITGPSQTSTLDTNEETSVDYYDLRKDKNAGTVTITVKYQDSAGITLSEETVAAVDIGQNFTWSIQLKDYLGTPDKFIIDNEKELKAECEQGTGYLLLYPVDVNVGITTNSSVTAIYKPADTQYLLNVFTQATNGSYEFAEVVTGSVGKPGEAIPKENDLNALKDKYEVQIGGFYLETYNTGQITQDGSASVEVVFARNIVSMSFDPNGGMNGPDTVYGRVEQEVPRSLIIPPNRAGYTFNGWKEDPSSPAGELPEKFPSYNTTYTAEWLPPQEGDLKQVHIVYWGEKAERDDDAEFKPEDFDFIGEVVLDNIPYHTDESQKWWPSETYWLPHNEKGDIYKDYADYWITQPKVYYSDVAVFVRPDNLTVFNIYYQRVKYKMEFWDSSGYDVLDTITAKWDQDINEQFKNITKKHYEGRESAPWRTSYYGNERVNLLTHMDDENRSFYHTGYSPPEHVYDFYYYLQKPYANYTPEGINPKKPVDFPEFDKAYTALLQRGNTISSDEFIPIYGFSAPALTDHKHAPAEGTDIEMDMGMYYKRNTWTLSLVSVLGNSPSDPAVYVTDAPFDLTLDQIRIPDNVPGTFIDDGEHILANYIPENPNIEHIDKNYVFKGWTTEIGGTQPITLENYKMPNSGFNIYAIWEAPGGITLNFHQVDDPAYPEGAFTPDPLENQTYNKPPDEIKGAKPFTNYEFISWYYYKNDSDKDQGIKTYFTRDLLVPGHDIELYPEYRYIGTNKYKIHYVYKTPDEDYESVASDTEGVGIIGETYTIKAKRTDQLYLDYRLFYVPSEAEAQITVSGDEVVEYSFIYVPAQPFTINYQVRYVYNTEDESIAWTEKVQTVTNKTMVTVSANIKEGYALYENEPTMKTVTLNQGDPEFVNYIDFIVSPITRTFTYQCDSNQGEVHLRVLEPDGSEGQNDLYSVTETLYDFSASVSGAVAAPAKGYKFVKWVMLDDLGSEVDLPAGWTWADGKVVLPVFSQGQTSWGKDYTFIAKFEVEFYKVDAIAYPDTDGEITVEGTLPSTLEYGTKYERKATDTVVITKKDSTEVIATIHATPKIAGKEFKNWYISNNWKDVKLLHEVGIIEDTSIFVASFSSTVCSATFSTSPEGDEFLINDSTEVEPLNYNFGANASINEEGHLVIDYDTPASKYFYGQQTEQIIYKPSTTDANYHFDKWVAKVDGEEIEDFPLTLTSNVEFVAKFSKIQYTVSFFEDPLIQYEPDVSSPLVFDSGTQYKASVDDDGKKAQIDFYDSPPVSVTATFTGEYNKLDHWYYSSNGTDWLPVPMDGIWPVDKNIIFKVTYKPFNVKSNIDVLGRCQDMGKINTGEKITLGQDYEVLSVSQYRVVPGETTSNNKLSILYKMPDGETTIEADCVAEPLPGYKLLYWGILVGEEVTEITPSPDPSFIGEDIIIRAVFDEAKVNVNFSTDGTSKGTVSAGSYDDAYMNTSYHIENNENNTESSIYIDGKDTPVCVATAYEGYIISKWTINGEDIPEEQADRKLKADNNFVVYFDKGHYTARFSSERIHYNFEPSDPEPFVDLEAFSKPTISIVPSESHYGIFFGNDITKEVLAKPNNGYDFDYFYATVDGDPSEIKLTEDFVITCDITIHAKVYGLGRQLTFKIAQGQDDYGTVSPSSIGVTTEGATYEIIENTVVVTSDGDSETVSADPNLGYRFSRWEVVEPEQHNIVDNSLNEKVPIESDITFVAYFEFYNVDVTLLAEGGLIKKNELQFQSNTTFTTTGKEGESEASITFNTTPVSTVVNATADAGHYFDDWYIRYGEEEVFHPIKQDEKTLIKNCEIKVVFNSKGLKANIVSSDPDRGKVNPAEGVFDIQSGTKVSISGNNINVGTDTYTPEAFATYKFSSWTYTFEGGIEKPFTEGEIIVNANITLKAYFIFDNAKYSFYYDDAWSTLTKNGNFSNTDTYYNEENRMINISVEFLSNSTFEFEGNKVTVTNTQDTRQSFEVTTDLKPGVVGYEFAGWYTCDADGKELEGPLTGSMIMKGDKTSNKILALYNNSGVNVTFIDVGGCTFDPPAKSITVKTGSIGAIYNEGDKSLSFKTSRGDDYSVKAIAPAGYNVLGWYETDSTGSTQLPIKEGGIEISSPKYFKPNLDAQLFNLEFETNLEGAGDIIWEHGKQIAGATQMSLALDNTTLCFKLPDQLGTTYEASIKTHTGYQFDHWEITIGGSQADLPCSINGNTKCVAVFVNNTRKLNLSVKDDTGGSISCGTGDFDAPYNSEIKMGEYNKFEFMSKNESGSYDSLTASPEAYKDYTFSKWEYNDGSGWQPLNQNITITSELSIRAVFEVSTEYILTFTAVNGSVNPSEARVKVNSTFTTNGTQLALSGGGYVNAQKDAHSTWKEWQYKNGDDWTGIDDGSVFTVTSDMEIRAFFDVPLINVSFEIDPADSGDLFKKSLSIKQYSVANTRVEGKANYIEFFYNGDKNATNYFEPYENYSFQCWQYRMNESENWINFTEGMTIEQDNMQFKALASKDVVNVQLRHAQGGTISPERPDYFSVTKGSKYVYRSEDNSIHFDSVVSGDVDTFSGKPLDMYAVNVWNRVEGGTYIPLQDGVEGTIDVDTEFGVNFNPKLTFEMDDPNTGEVEIWPSRSTEIIVPMGAELTYYPEDNAIGFIDIWGTQTYAKPKLNSGFTFNHWTAYNGDTPVGTPDHVDVGLKFFAYCGLGNIKVSFDNASIKQFGYVDPPALDNVQAKSTVSFNDTNAKETIIFTSQDSKTWPATVHENAGYDVYGWEYKNGEGWNELTEGFEVTTDILIRPKFNNAGVEITFSSNDENKGHPEPNTLSNIQTDSTYSYNYDEKALIFKMLDAPDFSVKAVSNEGFQFIRWTVFDEATQKYIDIPSDESQRVALAGLKFQCEFDAFSCALDFSAEPSTGGKINNPSQLSSIWTHSEITIEDKNLLFKDYKNPQQSITVSAIENAGYTFTNWEYSLDGINWSSFDIQPYIITSPNLYIRALFSKAGFKVTLYVDPEDAGDVYKTERDPQKKIELNSIDVNSPYHLSEDVVALYFKQIDVSDDTCIWTIPIENSGYDFDAWYVKNGDQLIKVIELSEQQRIIDKDTEFVAKYNTYDCSLHPQTIESGGKYIGDCPDPLTVTSKSVASITTAQVEGHDDSKVEFTSLTGQIVNLEAQANTGYQFATWEISTDGGGTWDELNNGYEVINKDILIKPVFSNIGVPITFYSDDGVQVEFPTGFLAQTDSVYKYEDKELTITDNTDTEQVISHNIITPGFYADGWQVKIDGTWSDIPADEESRTIKEPLEFKLFTPRTISDLSFDVADECTEIGKITGETKLEKIDSAHYYDFNIVEGVGTIKISKPATNDEYTITATGIDSSYKCVGCTVKENGAIRILEDGAHEQVLQNATFDFYFAAKPIKLNFDPIPNGYYVDVSSDGWTATAMPEMYVQYFRNPFSDSLFKDENEVKEGYLIFSLNPNPLSSPYALVYAGARPGYKFTGWEYTTTEGGPYTSLEEGATVQLTNVDNIWAHPTFETYPVDLEFKSSDENKGKVVPVELKNIETQTEYTVTPDGDKKSTITFGTGTSAKTVTATAEEGYHFDYWSIKIGESDDRRLTDQDKYVVDPTKFTAHFTSFPISVNFNVDPVDGRAGGYFDIDEYPTSCTLEAQSMDKFNIDASTTTQTESIFTLHSETPQTLKVVANPGFHFVGWFIGKTKVDEGTLKTNTDIVAKFETFTANVKGSIQEGQESCGKIYPIAPLEIQTLTGYKVVSDNPKESNITFDGSSGSTIKASANYDDGYIFDYWKIKIGDEEPVVFNPEIHKEIIDHTEFIAVFKTHPVEVKFETGGQNGGCFVDEKGEEVSSITKEIYTTTKFTCNEGKDTADAYFYFEDESKTTIRAHAYEGFHFIGWFVGSDEITEGTILKETTITAKFSKYNANVIVTADKDRATISGGEEHLIETFTMYDIRNKEDLTEAYFNSEDPDGQPINVTITAKPGYHFKKWHVYTDVEMHEANTTGQIMSSTRFVAEFTPFKCNLTVYGENAKPLYDGSAGASVNETNDDILFIAETYTITTYEPKGIAGDKESSLAFTNAKGIPVVRKFMNKGYYAFGEWQRKDETGSWVTIKPGDDTTIYGDTDLKVVYVPYDCKLNIETNSLPGSDMPIGEVKALDGESVPTSVKSNTVFSVNEGILTLTEPSTNKVYRLYGSPVEGFYFFSWTHSIEEVEGVVTGPMTFTANFSPKLTPYTVHWMFQDPNDEVNLPPDDKTYIEYGTYEYYGLTWEYTYSYIEDIEINFHQDGIIKPTNFDIKKIMGDGSTEVYAYFDRLPVHLITKDSYEDQEHFGEFVLKDRVKEYLYGRKCVVNSLIGDYVGDSPEYELLQFMYPNKESQEVIMGFRSTEISFLYNELNYQVDYVMSSADKGTIEPASEVCKVLTEQPQGATLTPAAGQTFLYWQEEDGTQLGSDLHVVPHNPWYDKYHEGGKLTLKNSNLANIYRTKAEDEESHVYDMKRVHAVFQSDFPAPVPDPGGDIWNSASTGDNIMILVFALLGVIVMSTLIFVIKRRSKTRN